MKKIAAGNAGFTLVEFVVVITIIAILTTVVALNVVGHTTKARIETTKSNIQTLKSALAIYKTDNGVYPTQQQSLEALVAKPSVPPVPESFPTDGYLSSRKVPQDGWGHDFIYLNPGRKGESFEIISYGSDGDPGGTGDAADISSSDL